MGFISYPLSVIIRRMIVRIARLLIILLFYPLAGWAIGPHEILILINSNSADSVRIGETYARLRRVPEVNVIRVGVQRDISMSAAEFKKTLFEPVLAESKRLGISSHVLAWVYAPDFPWRIEGQPGLSLTGLTFLRGNPPATNSLSGAAWASPFFAGPHDPGERGYEPRSLCMLSDWMGEEKPIAAWALAHLGERGMTANEAGAMLIRGIDSDGTRPDGTFYYVTNSDVRSRVREWQLPVAVEELTEMGMKVVVTQDVPRGVGLVAGLFTGQAVIEPQGTRLSAGALVDNLTSYGADFSMSSQTKCTTWLKAGAAAAGGTVSEPFAFWTKFPNARLFSHYVAGCTAIESYYQSIRQPLQYLPVGDPLAAPWKPKGEVTVEGMEDVQEGKPRTLVISVKHGGKALWHSFQILVDGRDAGRGILGDPYPWDPAKWGPGKHEFRVVVRTAGLLRHQAFVVLPYFHTPQEEK